MTNLLATISFVLVTNWTDTAITSPVVPESERFFAVGRSPTYHQSGIILSNTIATVDWKGKKVPVVLESVEIGRTNRVVSELEKWRNP